MLPAPPPLLLLPLIAKLLELTAGGDAGSAFLAQQPPAWPLPLGANALEGASFPSEWPWKAEDFRRLDESDDATFYATPNLVRHIDDSAIGAITQWYDRQLPKGDVSILDVCSSWISHLPKSLSATRVVGLGMNAAELRQNKQLTETVVQDLNQRPKFPFDDQTFDAIVNVVSVDYLIKPLEIFWEFRRLARPGALVAMSFSNRMFWTKAIERWTKANEFQRLLICASYFHFTGFEGVRAERINKEGRHDPMYVVFGYAPKARGSPEEL